MVKQACNAKKEALVTKPKMNNIRVSITFICSTYHKKEGEKKKI